jgi:tRNA 2-thiocytidine biosynthesis protein TtcA
MSDLERKLARKIAEATTDYQLIEDGDRILVGVSGGKDSWVMLHMLRRMQRVAPIKFELVAFHLAQGHPGFPLETLRGHLEAEGFEYVIYERDTYSVVKEKLRPDQTTCSLCSRLRRGIIYDQAVALGCNKIALGHHRDDIVETLLLNLFFSGQLKAMPPKLVSDDKRNIVIGRWRTAARSCCWRTRSRRGIRSSRARCAACSRTSSAAR